MEPGFSTTRYTRLSSPRRESADPWEPRIWKQPRFAATPSFPTWRPSTSPESRPRPDPASGDPRPHALERIKCRHDLRPDRVGEHATARLEAHPCAVARRQAVARQAVDQRLDPLARGVRPPLPKTAQV